MMRRGHVREAERNAANRSRQMGDEARDSLNWPDAERHYRAYLTATPSDWPIAVQLGHALKEQGKPADAELAYREALALQPDDGDVYLQLGHVLKLQNRLTDALKAYHRSFELVPLFETRIEIEDLSERIGAPSIDYRPMARRLDGSRSMVITELDDMLTYFEAHPTFSGIQRVQAEFALYIHNSPEVADRDRYVFVINPPFHGVLWQLDSERLLALIHYVMSADVDHGRLRQLVRDCRSTAIAVRGGQGHLYLALGAFWNFNTVAGRFFHLKEAGVTICGFIHDLIPINQPEYCDEPLVHEFELSFADCARTFDCFLANSHYTKTSIRDYFVKHGLEEVPTATVQLAHGRNRADLAQFKPTWTPKIAHLRDKPFVMMVSTIEARKNHAFLVAVWRHFYNNGMHPPDLVFVGRAGWRVHDLMGTLRQSRNFGGRLHILSDLSDDELNTLYAACLYTAFSSYVEGWGLPVGESVVHGRTCVASNASAIPEIAGDLIDYVDPLNIRDGIAVFEKMTFDTAYREARTAALNAKLKLRTWADFSRDLVKAVDTYVPTPRVPTPVPHLPPATFFRPGSIAWGTTLPPSYGRNPLRLTLASSWRPLEDWGCWMYGSRAALRFATELPAGTDIVMYLELKGSGHSAGMQAVVRIGDVVVDTTAKRNTLILTEHPAMMQAEGRVGPDGTATVEISAQEPVVRPPGQASQRQYLIGLHGFGYAAKADAASHIALAEAIIFTNQLQAGPDAA